MIKNFFRRTGIYNPGKERLSRRRSAITSHHLEFNEDFVRTVTKCPKKAEDELLIKSALENNDFLSTLLQGQRLQRVVDSMYPQEVAPNQLVIKEGHKGSHLYVSVKGIYEINQNGQTIGTFGDVRVFGELALLYDARRLATIKAKTDGKIWVLDRVIFKHIMVRSDIEEHQEMVSFLEKVPKLNKVNPEVLERVADLLQPEFFNTGKQIVREGEQGDTFYIIRAGTVSVSKTHEGVIDKLYKGQFFGEVALLKDDVRQATITAEAPGVECLTLTRQEFIDHFGELSDCCSMNYQTELYKPIEEIIEYTDLKIDDFDKVATLGVGGFGRVELVQHKTKPDLVFALKSMKKQKMLQQKDQEHAFNEKDIHTACTSKFIVRLYRTYRDNKYIYLLLEPCLGGDLWYLQNKQKDRRFEKLQARFYVACVVEAFGYIHERGIIYRDLKPENLLLDSKGYIKLTDFGFAKKLEPTQKTYTFAGTPEYVPPEIILNRGHDKAVDYWALGCFVFEMLVGSTPFRTNDKTHMKTYKAILRGTKEIYFPNQVPVKAKALIRSLCKVIPQDRLGCLKRGVLDIKEHAWFEGFNWDGLNAGTVLAPFKPNLKDKLDVHYFGTFPKDLDVPEDDISGWDEDF